MNRMLDFTEHCELVIQMEMPVQFPTEQSAALRTDHISLSFSIVWLLNFLEPTVFTFGCGISLHFAHYYKG